MTYDIVLVLHNSAAWLPGCLGALAKTDYDTSRLHLIAVDNASSDNGPALFHELAAQHGGFGGYTLIKNTQNTGFGAACNRGAAAGSAQNLFFLNVDTEVDPGIFKAIDAGLAAHPDAGGFECRQLPYEMGHHIDPVTLETPWASGAAFVVRRAVFEKVGGFDKHLFMYCEDIDLSWRIRAAGHPLYYLPGAVLQHHVLRREHHAASELREYAGTELGRLLLNYKYGSFGNIVAAEKHYLRTLRHPRHYDNVRRVFAANYMRHLLQLWPFWFWRWGHRALFKAAPAVLQGPFAPERGRAVLPAPVTQGPLISVVVRTCARPHLLRGALASIGHQTYQNYEVVVVEDGPPISQAMVEAEFSHLPLRYHATGQNIGRGAAGNLGLAMARGEYLNFLDDDDYFYPDHLELMAAKANEHPEADLVLGCAMAMKVQPLGADPYRYEIRELHTMLFDRLDIFTMAQTCQIPIQSAIFKKSLYETCGGLREDLEGHEDWAMWMRFLKVANRIDPHHVDIHRATSVFVQPASAEAQQERLERYRVYDQHLFNDPALTFTVSMADLRGFYHDTLGDIRHLAARGELDAFLQRQAALRAREEQTPAAAGEGEAPEA